MNNPAPSARMQINSFEDYQATSQTTSKYSPALGALYPLLGLCGESGEVAEKIRDAIYGDIRVAGVGEPVLANYGLWEIHRIFSDFVGIAKRAESMKKVLRDSADDLPAGSMERIGEVVNAATGLDRNEAIRKELGDVLWYITDTARRCGFTLKEIAQSNIDKLLARRERGTLKGSGDDR